MWKDMTADDKQKYEAMAVRDRERYEHEMKEFKAGRPVASRVAQQQQQQLQQQQKQQQQQQQQHLQHAAHSSLGGGPVQGLPGHFQQQMGGNFLFFISIFTPRAEFLPKHNIRLSKDKGFT